MRQLLFYDAPLRKHKTRKLAQYKVYSDYEETRLGKRTSEMVCYGFGKRQRNLITGKEQQGCTSKVSTVPHGTSQDLHKIASCHMNIIFRWHFLCYNIHHHFHLPEQPSKGRNRLY